ncbi:hypothetical protein [Granulicoccus phenolivorans]|uniref:hypothetical protein n=1 Tax=Granulicoccus phenolivorans TaxID=266854 RepID=UPI00047E9878|nr:hypothetical protein [Granulicoccus phenolivorans]
MPRKVSGADPGELLNSGPGGTPADPPAPEPDIPATAEPERAAAPAQPDPAAARPTASGRVRHEDKITVYVSRQELLRLEQARLKLRGEHGISADRGHIVRSAVAAALDDLAEHGADAELVRRLAQE